MAALGPLPQAPTHGKASSSQQSFIGPKSTVHHKSLENTMGAVTDQNPLLEICFRGGNSSKSRPVQILLSATVADLLAAIKERDPTINGRVILYFMTRQLKETDIIWDSGLRDGDLVTVVHLNPGGAVCSICADNDENVTFPCGKKACDECVLRLIRDEVPLLGNKTRCIWNASDQHDCHWNVETGIIPALRAADVSKVHIREVQALVTDATLHMDRRVRTCSLCGCMSRRQEGVTGLRVVCPICTAEAKMKGAPAVHICWRCTRQWKTKSSTDCGNKGCGDDSQLIKMLAEAPELGPEGCKAMKCASCRTKFCFCCLRGCHPNTTNLLCGGHVDDCPVAPRQTSIPSPPV